MRRTLLFTFVVAVVGYLVALAGVNVIANLERVRNRLGATVAYAIGEPLAVGRVRVGPLGRVHLFELEIDVEESSETGEQGERRAFFLGEEIQIRVAPFSIFGEDVRIREVVIVEPEFILTRGRDGKLLLPPGFGERMIRPEGSEAAGGGAGEAPAPGVVAPSVGTLTQSAPATRGGTAGLAPPAVLPPLPDIPPVASGQAGVMGGTAVVKGGSTVQPKVAPLPVAPIPPIVIRFGPRNYHFGEITMMRGSVEVVSAESGARLFEMEDMEMRMDIAGDPQNT
ncbi:MAG: hypothetical protein ACC661_06830, partial [Verrucomicrobiales bacterium]